jgi:hypothetical protein
MPRPSRVALATLLIATSMAHAQPAAPPAPSLDGLLAEISAESPLVTTIARGVVRRGRRAVSIGPTLGAYAAAQPSPGELDVALTFGLGLELFAVPVLPSREQLQQLALGRARERLVRALAGRQPPGAGDAEQLAREIWRDAVREVLALEDVRPRTMERPRLSLAIEGNRLVSSDVWAVRLRAGLGVWRLTVAGSLATAFTDPATSVFTGIELVAHFLTSPNPRASVVDVFVRGDFEIRNRDAANTDTIVIGVRYLLDVL